MKYLIDTCVLSEFIRKKPSTKLTYWMSSKSESNLYLSVLTLGELQQGISKLDDSKRKLSLQSWLDNDISKRFDGRILSIDRKIMDRWGRLRGEAMQHGKSFPVLDSLLAATAIAHGLTMVTRNVNDVKKTGVSIRNPWEDY